MRTAILSSPVKPVTRLRPVVRWAAAAAVVLVLASAWLEIPVHYVAEPGAELVVNLSDGSTVTLNGGTTVNLPRLFGWFGRRQVSLSGEAFFDVSKGRGIFEVQTFNGQVRVLGTRFNVRAWPDDLQRSTAVSVDEGTVEVRSRLDPNSSVQLSAGQSAVLSDALIRRSEVGRAGVSNDPAWRSGGMAFPDTPLGDVISEVERRFGVSVAVTPDSLRYTHVSLFVGEARSAGTVLEMIAAAQGLEVHVIRGGFEITHP